MELHNTFKQPARIAILLQGGSTLGTGGVASAVQDSNLPMQVWRTRTDKRKLSSLGLTLGHSVKAMPSTQGSLALSQSVSDGTMSTTVTGHTLCKGCGLDVASHLGRCHENIHTP